MAEEKKRVIGHATLVAEVSISPHPNGGWRVEVHGVPASIEASAATWRPTEMEAQKAAEDWIIKHDVNDKLGFNHHEDCDCDKCHVRDVKAGNVDCGHCQACSEAKSAEAEARYDAVKENA